MKTMLEGWNYKAADEDETEILFLTIYGKAKQFPLLCQLKSLHKYRQGKGNWVTRSCMRLESQQQSLSASGWTSSSDVEGNCCLIAVLFWVCWLVMAQVYCIYCHITWNNRYIINCSYFVGITYGVLSVFQQK